ncbi:triphosphoribosyl-dephospho-CoA synthase CitG [Paenibacillus sp. sgz500992]|uniref:triphosphoribosyl-dephospho-CoA synthase CitG n=1 Tax=Paenibacillus sp. sgz500992 TaxID=3242476 RepID=UPI0036D41DFF
MEKEKIVFLNEISLTISSFALQSILYEVSCFPSPGLVSPTSNGAHEDMDYFTFIDSTAVLSKYLALFVQHGYSSQTYLEIFKDVRALGVKAEEEMFMKTKGINTHKGMLFLMGIACAAVGKAFYEKKTFGELRNIIIKMANGLVENDFIALLNKPELSHGEKIYLKYKIEGIRGEVERGMPIVFQYSLELFKQNADLSINDRLVHTLIGLMAQCNDTTILHRHSIEKLESVKEKARVIIEIGGMKSTQGKERIAKMSQEFITEKISPGGSADLLAITVFLFLVEQYMNKEI